MRTTITAVTNCKTCRCEIRYASGTRKPRICVQCDEPQERNPYQVRPPWVIVAGPPDAMRDFGGRLFQMDHVIRGRGRYSERRAYPEFAGCRLRNIRTGQEVQL